jgi:hypothetical protein
MVPPSELLIEVVRLYFEEKLAVYVVLEDRR